MIVIDDRLLLDVVVGSATPAVEPYLRAVERRELYTTGYWYWRLARAIAHPTGGSLSGPFADDSERGAVDLALDGRTSTSWPGRRRSGIMPMWQGEPFTTVLSTAGDYG